MLVFFINQQTSTMVPEKRSTVASAKAQKSGEELVLHTTQWSTVDYPAVHSKLSHENDLRRRWLQ
jgi:hypothetical protein